MKLRLVHAMLLAAAALGATFAPARAQVFTPPFLAPQLGPDLGVYLSAGVAPDDGLAIEGVWRRPFGSYELGVRGGLGEVGGSLSLLLGGDYRNPLPVPADLAPLLVAVTGGAQLAVGGSAALGLDAGVSVGSRLEVEGVPLTPYLNPRLGVVTGIPGTAGPDLTLLVDLGVDVELGGGRVARLAIGLGQHTAALGMGLGWR